MSAVHVPALPVAEPGAVGGLPRLLLRAEAVGLAGVALAAYGWAGLPWWLVAALFLVPDLSALGLAAGPAVGAWAYDLAHTSALPLALTLAGVLTGSATIAGLGAIWLLHVGVDRAVGYGLRYPHDVDLTHLGRRGRGR